MSIHLGSGVGMAIQDAILHEKMGKATRAILKETPEYAEAVGRGEGRAWLARESESLGYALAALVRDRINHGGLE